MIQYGIFDENGKVLAEFETIEEGFKALEAMNDGKVTAYGDADRKEYYTEHYELIRGLKSRVCKGKTELVFKDDASVESISAEKLGLILSYEHCDELETRLPAGKANLCTSSLYYDALRHAAILERELGHPKFASDYSLRAEEMKKAIERHFGCSMRGYDTYRYYDGCEVLRSWIGIPLCMGLFNRAEGTADALFSPGLWTGSGMLSAEGDKKGVTWDRSVLYAFRGVFASGLGDRVFDKFLDYSRTRLLGEHVPYPVEAWPEQNMRHLSAESALYCRIVTEGLFGIDPTGLGKFEVKAHLPKGVERMTLKNVRVFGRVLSITADEAGVRISH